MGTQALLPGALRLAPSYAFAGRADELATLRALLPRATGEGRRAAFVAGEAGSGKSRLVRELAHDVAAEGATVLYGDCDGVVASPFGPFAEALEQLVGQLEPEALGSAGPELRRLLPGIGPAGGAGERQAADADAQRLRLHTAVTDVLTESARSAPVLLVLEDVHWADAPTLLLLRHLVRSAADARLLLVATFRDSVDEVTPGLADALVDVSRTEGVVRIRLGGLTTDEVGEFVRLAAGTAPTAELTATLAELTGGNAFLLTELWRELVESGGIVARPGGVVSVRPAGEVAAPTTVREMVGQRVSRLEPETTSVLELAAVAGAGFELETIRHASGLPDEALLAAVDGAVQSGLVVEESGPVLAYRFEHELVRRAVADRLSAARRAETHLRVAEALEQTAPHGDSRARLAALAHHYASAAGVGGRERAVSYNLLAAESAVAALAFEEAAARFRTALELGLAEPRERAETLLQLGDAARRAGDVEVAIGAFGDVAELARRLGDAELLARAAIEYEEACWRPAIHDDAAAVGLLREAATALGAGDSELHARLLGGLARALDLRGDPAPAARARDASIAMSRRRDDRRTLATTLAQSYWAQGSSTQTAVNAMLREARELGRALGDPDLEAEASSWLVPSYVVLCDHESARAQLAELLLLVQRSNEPFFLHVAEHYRAALALCDGDLDAAERGAIQSRDWGMLLTGRDASGPYGIQMFGIRREQGRLAELAPAVRLLDARTRDGAWRPGLAVVLAELGMADEARAALHHVLDDGLGALRSSLWIASLVYMADAAALLDDRDAAAVLYPELAAHVGGERHGRPPRRLLRRDGPLPRDDGDGARRLGAGRGALPDGARAQHAPRSPDVARPHRLLVRADAARARPRGGRRPAPVAPRAGGRPGAGDRPADAPRARLRARRPGAGARRAPRRPLRPRGRDPRRARPRPLESRDRPPPPHLRAHRREPRPLDPPQDAVGEPHRGRRLRHAPRARPRLNRATIGRCRSM